MARIGIACGVLEVAFAASLCAQNPNPPILPEGSNGASSTPSEQVLQVFRDPVTGREMERVRVTRYVPEQRYQTKEIKESRAVQEWTTETKQTTQMQYTPVTQYQMRSRIVGRWNPFAQPQLAYDHVPVTTWQANPVPVTVPMTYPKWVTREQVVQVPELVQTNRPVQVEVIRPRNSASTSTANNAVLPPNSVPLANASRNNPSQLAANQAMQDRNAPTVSPYTLSPIVSNGLSTAHPYGQTSMPLAAVTPPAVFDPGRWMSGGKLINASYNRNAPQSYSSIASTWPASTGIYPQAGYAPAPYTSAPSYATTSIFPRPTFASTMGSNLLRPSTARPPTATLPRTAAIPGSSTWREPIQTGLQPTELR